MSQMEMLGSKFNSLINQYKDTYQQYMNAIQSNSNTLTSVSNYAFIGENNLNTIQNSSASDCLSSCTSTQSCSGATYDATSNVCTLSTGTGNMVSSTNQTAIVKQALYYSNQLKQLNDDLTNINNQMIQHMNQNAKEYSQNQQQTTEKVNALQQNYSVLEQERSQIDEMIREYETLNSAYENGAIHVTSNYYVYLIYFIIVIALIAVLIKIGISGGNPSLMSGGGHGHIKVSPWLLFFLAIVILFNAYIKK